MTPQLGKRMAASFLPQSKHPPRSFYYSLLLHVIILTVLIVSFDFSATMPVLKKSDKDIVVINATAMDMPSLPAKMPSKLIPPKPIPPKPIAPPLPPPSPVEPIKSVKNVQQLPIKKLATAISTKKPRPPLKEDLRQKQLLADLKKQTTHQTQIKQKAIQSAFEKEITELKAQSLQQQMQREQKRLLSARVQQTQGEVNKYKALILQMISQHWLIPNNANKKLFAELLIRMAPGGVVLEVQLMKSSGDEALDRSARAAVFKASPLPVPAEAEAFAAFKQFVLKVKPENVLTDDSWLR
jgi:colicin import membrane protein